MPKHLLFLFAPDNGSTGAEQAGQPVDNATTSQNQPSAPSFDYEKLISIVTGKQTVAEDTVLKNYFKQQGMSQEEMTQAIDAFKKQKQETTPDVGALQQELAQTRESLQRANLEGKLQIAALKLGVDVNTLPYILKMADLSTLTLDSTDEDISKVVSKVLEDVPALKPTTQQTVGFQQVGSVGANNSTTDKDDALKRAFGIKF